MEFTREEIESLIKSIYYGIVGIRALPVDLYNSIAKYLFQGVVNGYGGNLTFFEYNSTNWKTLKALEYDIYLFSGAKTFQYTNASASLIVQNGAIVPFDQFYEEASSVYNMYNRTWLEAEYVTAIGQAESARSWDEFDDDDILEYQTRQDEMVSPICFPKNGIRLPKSHPFWREHAPKSHYRCRCELILTVDEPIVKPSNKVIKNQVGFQSNVGITKRVFDKDHPYYDVPESMKPFAMKNFNLPLPQ